MIHKRVMLLYLTHSFAIIKFPENNCETRKFYQYNEYEELDEDDNVVVDCCMICSTSCNAAHVLVGSNSSQGMFYQPVTKPANSRTFCVCSLFFVNTSV